MKNLKNIHLQLINLFMPVGSLSFAWYLQLYQNVIPCSLCLLQRWGMYISLFFALAAIVATLLKLSKTAIALTFFPLLVIFFH